MPDLDATVADLLSLEGSGVAFTDARVDACVDAYLAPFHGTAAIERVRLADAFKWQAPDNVMTKLILGLIRGPQ